MAHSPEATDFQAVASAEWLPSMPPAGAWPSVTGLAVLGAGHTALWAGMDVGCGWQAAGGFCSWAPLVASVPLAAPPTHFVLPQFTCACLLLPLPPVSGQPHRLVW